MLGVHFFNKNALKDCELNEHIHFKFDDFHLYTKNKHFTKEKLHIFIDGKITKSFDNEFADFKSQEELVFDLHKKHMQSFVEKLDGIFSIVIYNEQTNEVGIYNNRYTCHKLYYYQDENIVAFSDKIVHLIEHFLEKPQPHLGSIKSFLANGFTISDQTQIKGIKKVLPTFSLHIKEGQLNVKNHWENEITFNRSDFKDVDKKIEEYTSLYQNGIKNFLDAHKPNEVGTLLSGGNDTSFVLANLSKLHDKPIHAYTTTFPGWAWNEESYAKNICNKFDGIFHGMPFEAKDLDSIIDLITACEEPVVGSSLPLHLIGKRASSQVDVMFGGDGGDTLWGEYYPVAEYHKYIKDMPLGLRKFAHFISKSLVKLTDWERFWELEHVASLFTKNDYYKNFLKDLCTYRHFNEEQQKSIFSDELNACEIPKSTLEIEFTKENFSDALIEGKLFNAFYTYQSFHTYKSMEYSGLELYFPTIQKDVIDLITNLPNKWVNGGTTLHRLTNHKSINRRLHKKALSGHLRQDEIYNRSFDIPWYKILKPRTKVLELLRERLIKRKWFKEDALHALFDEFNSQKVKDYELLELKHHGYRIFTLLSLEVWCIKILDKGFMKDKTDLSLEEYLS